MHPHTVRKVSWDVKILTLFKFKMGVSKVGSTVYTRNANSIDNAYV